jgi:flagellar hook-associated protein FlgK
LLNIRFGAKVLVTVLPSEVRERINVSATEAPDDVVNRFIIAGAVTVETETGSTVDPANCTKAEAEAIRNLAAIYCACRITGGSAQGLSFRVGDLAVNESSSNSSGLGSGNLQFLLNQAVAIIDSLKGADFRAVNA